MKLNLMQMKNLFINLKKNKFVQFVHYNIYEFYLNFLKKNIYVIFFNTKEELII